MQGAKEEKTEGFAEILEVLVCIMGCICDRRGLYFALEGSLCHNCRI
jgi:hypothetical protein